MHKFLFFIILLYSCTIQRQPIEEISIVIDSSIVEHAKRNISDAPKLSRNSDIIPFKTFVRYSKFKSGMIDFEIDSTELMSGVYFWKNDSLILNIGPDLLYETVVIIFNGVNEFPFYVQTHHDNEAKFYKLQKTDSTTNPLYVPFDTLRMILSSLPQKEDNIPIYGHVNFKTKTYYFDNSHEQYPVFVKSSYYFKADHVRY